MEKIRLSRGEWSYDPNDQIGRSGGFGAVFAGKAEGHGPLVVKRLHVSAHDAAHRELRLAEDLAGQDLSHVVPILDAGQDVYSTGFKTPVSQATSGFFIPLGAEMRAPSGTDRAADWSAWSAAV